MPMGNDLRVEKREEKVSLFLADGVVFEGIVFLAHFAMHHTGEQTVRDLLLESNPFLPMKVQDGAFHLVRKGMISHVRCQVELQPGLAYVERQVRVSFLGNQILQGTIKLDLPDNQARLTDYINQGHEFFPLYSGDHAYLVNRSLIRDIVLMG